MRVLDELTNKGTANFFFLLHLQHGMGPKSFDTPVAGLGSLFCPFGVLFIGEARFVRSPSTNQVPLKVPAPGVALRLLMTPLTHSRNDRQSIVGRERYAIRHNITLDDNPIPRGPTAHRLS